MSFKLSIGRVGIPTRDMYSNEAIAAFHVSDSIDSMWLYYELPRVAARAVTDTAVKGLTLNKAKLKQLTLSQPPVREQRCIAEILDTLDEAIRKTEQIVVKLKQVKQGLLHDLLTRGIDHNGELRDPLRCPEQFKDSPLGLIPVCWRSESLESAVTAPICYGIVQSGHFFSGGPQVLTIGDLARDFRGNIHRSSPQIEQRYVRSRTMSGDVILSIKGTIGRVAVVPPWYEGNISRDLARLRLGGHHSPQFLRQYFLSPLGRLRLEFAVVGTTRAEISIRVLKRLTIPIVPRAEQDEIAQRLDELDRTLESEAIGLSKLMLVRTGLAEDLLTGRVRLTSERTTPHRNEPRQEQLGLGR